MLIITLIKMTKVKIIQTILIFVNNKFKNSNKLKRELRLLHSYISKSDLYKGDKKRLYKLIKSYSK